MITVDIMHVNGCCNLLQDVNPSHFRRIVGYLRLRALLGDNPRNQVRQIISFVQI